jgi:hypothetical protein
MGTIVAVIAVCCMLGAFAILGLSVVYRNATHDDVYQNDTKTICGETFDILVGTSYKRNKKTGNLIEYHYDSQGGCWSGIEETEQEIIKSNIVFEEGKYILTKKA